MEQYVIVPRKDEGEKLQKYEILIYVCIRRYMNKDTMLAFPSMTTIAKDSGCSKPTILKTIKEIVRKGYLQVTPRQNKSTVFKFNNERTFEPFSYKFLDNENLTKSEKLQILCTQQYMFKMDGDGKISYSDRELSKLTGLDARTINKNNLTLMEKDYMTQVELRNRDPETGELKTEKIYHLDKFGQAVVFALGRHEKMIQDVQVDVATIKQEFASFREETKKDKEVLLNEIKRLQEENKNLKYGEYKTDEFGF